MAKYETNINRGFREVLETLDEAILSRSATASFEDGSDFHLPGASAAVRVYERYSMFGGNRLTLTLTIVGDAACTQVSAITSGGSQAMFFKINTLGEDAFLDTVIEVLNQMGG